MKPSLQLILIFLLLLQLSCIHKVRYNCEAPSTGITLNFNFPGISNYKAAKYWDIDSVKLSNVALDDKDFHAVLNGIKISEPLDHLYMVILYLDKDLGKAPDINPDNIIAFSSYFFKEPAMYHKLYMNQDSSGTFTPVEKYTCTVAGIRTNDPHAIAKQLMKNSEKPVTWLMMHSDQIKDVEIKSEHQLTEIVKAL